MSPQPESIRAAWAHRAGVAGIGSPADAQRLTLEQRLDVLEVVHRYPWTYDERMADGMRSIFTPDAGFDGDFWGEGTMDPLRGIDAILAWQQGWWDAQTDQRRHVLSNEIFVAGAEGDVVVLCNVAITAAEGDSARLAATGFYRFTVTRFEDEWRISHVFAGFDNPF